MNDAQSPGQGGQGAAQGTGEGAGRDLSPPQDHLKAPYEPPQIVSSRIFHKVLLASPQPGIPGCSAY